MTINELCTNASKHGALTVPGGRVIIATKVNERNGTFRFKWSEKGGPHVGEPSRRSFGMFLIEKGFAELARFLAWCGKQGLVERNICDHFDRDEKPRGAASRDHVPSLDELRGVWSAVENEPQRDLIRFLLLVPLRREEAAGLRWSEIDLPGRRIRIAARRAKTRETHELPLKA